MLEVTGVRVAFDGVVAVDDVSFEVGKGEVVAVLGPSGSGKSTLLRCVAGLQRPDAGTVHVEDADVTATAPHARGVGFMFQAPTLFPHRDVAGNVGFGLRMQRVGKDTAGSRVAELLDLVGLPGTQGRTVSTLSGGEQQRVALARALAPQPRLLLLDEPFGALDAVLRQRLVEDVGRLVRRIGLSVVAVTHDREEAYALADRVLVMRDGRLVADGTPEQLWAAPADAWVASFLGMPNVLPAEVDAGTARTAWGALPVAADAEGSHVVVPTGAVRVGPTGDLAAVVVARTFLDDRVRLVLRRAEPVGGSADDAPGTELFAVVPVAGAPAVEREVRVAIGAGDVLVLR